MPRPKSNAEPTENTPKSIVRWDPIFEGKELSKPIELGISVAFNVYPTFCIANRGAKSKEDHLDQGMVCTTIYTWVGNFFKVIVNFTNE